MKKYIYKLTLEDGTAFNYTIDAGIMFNAKNEVGEDHQALITSAIFVECIDVEESPVVVEAESVSKDLDEE